MIGFSILRSTKQLQESGCGYYSRETESLNEKRRSDWLLRTSHPWRLHAWTTETMRRRETDRERETERERERTREGREGGGGRRSYGQAHRMAERDRQTEKETKTARYIERQTYRDREKIRRGFRWTNGIWWMDRRVDWQIRKEIKADKEQGVRPLRTGTKRLRGSNMYMGRWRVGNGAIERTWG